MNQVSTNVMAGKPTAGRAYLSFRVGSPQWLSDATFKSLKKFFAGLKGVAREVAFFTSDTHAPLPLESATERAEILTRRMAEFRKLGFRAGINVLCTIGHHNENLPYSLKGEYDRATTLEGMVLNGVYCWNDQRFLKGYVVELYKLMTAANPDFIWIDDDVRSGHGIPGGTCCFCDNCIKLFNQKFSRDYTRAALNNALNNDNTRLETCDFIYRFREESIAQLLALIENTVHSLRPGLTLGFMSGELGNYAGRYTALAGKDKAEVMCRPGGTADDMPEQVLNKAHRLGRQVALLPPDVRLIQSEIENFPYEMLLKDEQTTILGSAAYIAAGCTGAAFNVLSMYAEPLDEYRSLARAIRKAAPFLDLLVAEFGRIEPVGVGQAWSPKIIPGMPTDIPQPNELWEIGIPMAYSRNGSRVMAIAGQKNSDWKSRMDHIKACCCRR